jgi:hypothetical protein
MDEDDEYYDRCVVCFGKEDIRGCVRCTYKVCDTCFLEMCHLRAELCVNHPGCREFYYNDTSEKHKLSLCKRTVIFCVKCPTCTTDRYLTMKNLEKVIRDKVLRNEKKILCILSRNKNSLVPTTSLNFFSIKDIDSGCYSIVSYGRTDHEATVVDV